jgi:hypothetical protein
MENDGNLITLKTFNLFYGNFNQKLSLWWIRLIKYHTNNPQPQFNYLETLFKECSFKSSCCEFDGFFLKKTIKKVQ